eukprot:Platyproteum_vivax@DN8482_c0_g1_i1.p1
MEVLSDGSSWQKPNDLSTVTVRYTVQLMGDEGWETVAETETHTFKVDMGETIPAIDLALKRMKKGARVNIRGKPPYAFGKDEAEFKSLGLDLPSFLLGESPALASLLNRRLQVLNLELISFEQARQSSGMEPKERREHFLFLKNLGNDSFKQTNYHRAIRRYAAAEQCLVGIEKETGETGDEKTGDDKTGDGETANVEFDRQVAKVNLALCCLQVGEYSECVKVTTDVLKSQPLHVKALFRRASAYYHLAEPEKALADLVVVAKLEPDDSSVKNLVLKCKHLAKQQKEKDK